MSHVQSTNVKSIHKAQNLGLRTEINLKVYHYMTVAF